MFSVQCRDCICFRDERYSMYPCKMSGLCSCFKTDIILTECLYSLFFLWQTSFNRLLEPLCRKQRDTRRRLLFLAYTELISVTAIQCMSCMKLCNNCLYVLEKLRKLNWVVTDVVKCRINKYWKNVSIILWKIWKLHSMYQGFCQQARQLPLATMFFQKKMGNHLRIKQCPGVFFPPSSKWLNKELHCQKPKLTVYTVHLQTEEIKRMLWHSDHDWNPKLRHNSSEEQQVTIVWNSLIVL